MPVTKRLRYEVLRRDNHTCRYCGASAPDVKLTIDHVIPQALGGPDEPSNLVTACEPCNSGKTSIPADSAVVADVKADALRWSAAMKQAAEIAHADFQARQAYRDLFREAWDDWSYGPDNDRTPIPLDDNWQNSLDNFREVGLPDWELEEAVRAAMSAQKVKPANTFRYFCGIAWTKIRKIQEGAKALLETSQDDQSEKSEQELLQESAAWVALHVWLSAWHDRHGSWPSGEESAQFEKTLEDGFVRENLKGKNWTQIYRVLTAAHEAGLAGVVRPEWIFRSHGIIAEQADPLRYADKLHRDAWDLYMSVFYTDQAGESPEEADLIELGDDIADSLEGICLTLEGVTGDQELEARFRKGRSWEKAAAAARQAFEAMISEQSPRLHLDGHLDGLEVEEIRQTLLEEKQPNA